MTDPVRFSDDGDPALALLLRAAQKERPPRRALEKTISSLGAATTVIGVTQGAAAAVTASKLGIWTLAKWAGAGVVSGVLTIGGAELVQHGVKSSRHRASGDTPSALATAGERAIHPQQSGRSFPPVPSPAADSVPALPERSQSTEAAASLQRHEAPGGKFNGAVRASPIPRAEPVTSESDSTISVEIGLIDEARRALQAGRAASALEALNRHRSEVKRPRLAPEARYLEMEAFFAAGNRLAAQNAASALLERYPKGPHAVRARSILAQGGQL